MKAEIFKPCDFLYVIIIIQPSQISPRDE